MSQDIEKQINQLNQKLQSVFKEQNRNQSAIQTQEQAIDESNNSWKCKVNKRYKINNIVSEKQVYYINM